MTDQQVYGIAEIFESVQFEGPLYGEPAVFVRFSGCNLACDFCDTDHTEQTRILGETLLELLLMKRQRTVVLTGGEPLLQNIRPLVAQLMAAGKLVQIETNGTQDVSGLGCCIVCSPKVEWLKLHSGIQSRKYSVHWKILVDSKGAPIGPIPEALPELYGIEGLWFQPMEEHGTFTADAVDGAIDAAITYNGQVSVQVHKLIGLR